MVSHLAICTCFKKNNGNLTVRSGQRTEDFSIWDADDGKVDTGDVGTGTAVAISRDGVFSDPESDAAMLALKSRTSATDASKVSGSHIMLSPAGPATSWGVAWAGCNKAVETSYILIDYLCKNYRRACQCMLVSKILMCDTQASQQLYIMHV